MQRKISATIEDYLLFMYLLERDNEPVIGTRLAELLGVTPPTVTNTLKRMVRDEMIIMDTSRTPHLTEQGYKAATEVMRKHMLAEWMLAELLPWSELHQEAHELEHAISHQVEAALLSEHNNPKVCPHGNPFPGHEAAVAPWIPLTQAVNGTCGVIRRVHEFAEENAEVLHFLEKKRIIPGQEIIVVEILPFNETVTIRVGEEVVPLGFALARYVFFEQKAETFKNAPAI